MSVDTVRALVNDKAQAASVTETGDGATVRYNLPYYPVVAASYAVYVNGSLQTETTHYSINRDTGVVTFVTAPTSGHAVRVDYSHHVISDDDIEAFLTLYGDSDLRAAAQWCNTVAGQQVLVMKVVQLLDVRTDGAAMSRELRQMAKWFMDQADSQEVDDGWDWAEMVTDAFGARERIWNQALRGAL